MPSFLLHNQHDPRDCAAVFASWTGFDSPLRHGRVISTCLTGGHGLWWLVDAPDGQAALEKLPPFVARRTTATEIREVGIG